MFSVEPTQAAEYAAFAVLVAALTALQFRYRLLQYVFFLRVPLAHALVLLLLPLAVWTRAFGNLFVVTPLQLAAVTFMLVLSTWAVTYAWGLIFIGAAPRFRLRFRQPDDIAVKRWDHNPRPNKLMALLATERRRAYIVPVVLGAPVVWFCARQSASPLWEELLYIGGGLALAFCLREISVWAGRRFRRWLYGAQAAVPASRFFNLRWRIRQAAYQISETMLGRAFRSSFSTGYSHLSSDEPSETGTPLQESDNAFSHWRALCFIALALLVYAAGAIVLNPSRPSLFLENTPALAYVLLVVTLFGLVLPAVTFFIDYYRVPVVVLLVVLLAWSYRFSDLDHYYDFSTAAYPVGAIPEPLSATQAVERWNARHPASSYPVMVVVAVSGGGSHAARWTTEGTLPAA